MAGDWIKMRGNLWDDPRVASLCDATDSTEAQIIGGLYWLWATADQHSEDGVMPGLTLRAIDRKTGIQGFGAALCGINWLADHPEGVRITRFKEHNGKSAKARATTAKRVATYRAEGSDVTQPPLQERNATVTPPLAREREREREEEDQKIRPAAPLNFKNVDPQVVQDFKAHRHAKKAPITATALAGIEREAQAAGITLQDALVLCCNRGWVGFKSEWVTQPRASPQSFAEQDVQAKHAAWEQMTGRKWPDANVIEMERNVIAK